MQKSGTYLMFLLISGIHIFLSGCNENSLLSFNLHKTIEEGLAEKLTIEEYSMFVDTLFAGDSSVQGSIGWLEEKIKDRPIFKNNYVTDTTLFLLFTYSSEEFPTKYEEGNIFSDVGYALTPHNVDNIGLKSDEHIEWFAVGRVRREHIKGTQAQVRLDVWLLQKDDNTEIQKLYEIKEVFKYKNEKWEMETFEEKAFRQI